MRQNVVIDNMSSKGEKCFYVTCKAVTNSFTNMRDVKRYASRCNGEHNHDTSLWNSIVTGM